VEERPILAAPHTDPTQSPLPFPGHPPFASVPFEAESEKNLGLFVAATRGVSGILEIYVYQLLPHRSDTRDQEEEQD
jgi:hypothetical protein